MEQINPPAMVQPATLNPRERRKLIMQKFENRRSLGRRTLEESRDIGALLEEQKKAVGHGHWMEEMEQMGISSSSAEDCMTLCKGWHKVEAELAKFPPGGIMSFKDAVVIAKETPTQATTYDYKLCRPCRTNGAKPDCPECRKLNESTNGTNSRPRASASTRGSRSNTTSTNQKPPSSTREPGSDEEEDKEREAAKELKDEEGHPVPPDLAPAFLNLVTFKEIDSAVRTAQTKIDEVSKLAGGEQLAQCLQPTTSGEKIVNRSQHLNDLKRDVRSTRPYSVCPWCKGKKCGKCGQTGWVSRITWNSAEEAVKARLSC